MDEVSLFFASIAASGSAMSLRQPSQWQRRWVPTECSWPHARQMRLWGRAGGFAPQPLPQVQRAIWTLKPLYRSRWKELEEVGGGALIPNSTARSAVRPLIVAHHERIHLQLGQGRHFACRPGGIGRDLSQCTRFGRSASRHCGSAVDPRRQPWCGMNAPPRNNRNSPMGPLP